VVALGIDLSGESSGLQASHPDPLQPLPDLNIGDRRVRRDRQHLVEQTDPSLRGAGPLRELLDQPVASVALPAGQHLIEQADDFIAHIHGGLAEQPGRIG
jgi:hypothetical protein